MYIYIHHFLDKKMHRTQIYLQDDLHETLKAKALSVGVSMSELIRRTLEKEIERNPVAEARMFFENLTPLESFRNVDPRKYVDGLRGKSRLLRSKNIL
jgi:post-segregation antitoxin (ccd killing protein)